jgi:hypothetical protein
MNELNEFEILASEVDLALPCLLQSLLKTEQTIYGPDFEITWHDKSLHGKIPFISWFDFEWISASDARIVVKEWLNPEYQNGKIFLPFAQSGAGDAYCIMPIDKKSVGVALVWHNDDTSQISYKSFDNFVAIHFLKTFANLDHFSDDDFCKEEILQCVKSDVNAVTEMMNVELRNYLRSFCELPLSLREFRYGPKSKPQNVLALISQEQLEIELAKFQPTNLAPFSVVPRWEINSSVHEPSVTHVIPETIVNWCTYAKNPKQKLLAIQSYREEFGVSLTEAKAAIDKFIIEYTNII